MSVRVRYFAAAKAALGRASDEFDGLPDVAALEARLVEDSPESAAVLGRCSYLVDGVSTTDRATGLTAGSSVDVLPPFAGG